MRYILIAILFAACGGPNDQATAKIATVKDTVHKYDTVYLPAPVANTKVKDDSIRLLKDTINAVRVRLNLANYKANKLSYYISIVVNKPSQLIFLNGWRNRAMRQK